MVDIFIGIIIGAFMSAVLSAEFWMIGDIFNYNEKLLRFYSKLFWYSLVIADISFMCIMCIILIKA
jgi:hypothetical protein